KEMLAALQLAQPMQSQVAQRRFGWEVVADQLAHGAGYQHLPAVRECADLGAAVHRDPPPISAVRIRLSGVEGDADLNAHAAWPLLPRQGALNVECARHGVTRAREQREGAITRAAFSQRRSPAGHNGGVDQLLVAPQNA